MNEKLYDLIITTGSDQRLLQLDITYTQLVPDTLEHRIWLQRRDQNETYYLVELPAGTKSKKLHDDHYMLYTTVEHILPDGKVLTETRKYSFEDALYTVSWFEMGKEYEGVIEPESSGKFPGRFQFHYYDTDADRHVEWVLATGDPLEIRHNRVLVAGRIEHQLPDGYIFQPLKQSDIHPFVLKPGMIGRLTLWEYRDE